MSVASVIEFDIHDAFPLLIVAQTTWIVPAFANGVGTLLLTSAAVVFATQGVV